MTKHPAPEHILHRLLMKGRLRQFQMIITVADLGNSYDAARNLSVSQPAVIKAIQDFEELLGLTIFERHARGMRPTPVGQELLLDLRRIINTTGRFAETVAVHHSTESSAVRVGAVAAGLNGVLAHHLPIFAGANPDIHIRVDEVDGRKIAALLADGDFDVILCRRQPMLAAPWTFTPLFWDEHAIVTAPDHPLAGRRNLSVEDLDDRIWLTATTGVPSFALLENLMARCRNPRFCKIATRSPVIIHEALRQSGAMAIVPISIFQSELAAGHVVRIAFDLNSPNAPIGMIVRQDMIGTAATRLVTYLHQHAAPARDGADQ